MSTYVILVVHKTIRKKEEFSHFKIIICKGENRKIFLIKNINLSYGFERRKKNS